MMAEVMRRSILGLGFAAIITFIVLTVLMVQDVEVPVSIIWKNMLGSMIMGIYFGGASFIFDLEEWSPLKRTILHFFISIFVWIPLAMWIGWVPLKISSILIGIGTFILTYVVFWYVFYLYFKRIEEEMNHTVKR